MRAAALALASLAALTAACGDRTDFTELTGSGSEAVAPDGPSLYVEGSRGTVQLFPDTPSVRLAVGDTFSYDIRVTGVRGGLFGTSAKLRIWSTDSAVATLSQLAPRKKDLTATALVRAVAPGQAWMVSRAHGFAPDSILVIVGDGEGGSIGEPGAEPPIEPEPMPEPVPEPAPAPAPEPDPAPAPAPIDTTTPAPAPAPAPSPTPTPTPTPAPTPTPTPTNPGGSHEPTGMTLLTDRNFASKATTTSDRAGSQGWDPIEGRYGNLSIVSDASAPFSASTVAQMKYPAGMQAGVAPGMAQVAFSNRKQELYISTWVKLSSNFYGNQSSTNKMFFVWIANGARFFISAEGAGMNPLVPQIRLQGKYIPDARPRLLPNVVPSATLKRGQWQHWELRLVANTPGQFNGIVQWWLDGQLISDYRDVAFVASGESNLWQQFQWSPTYGGGGAGVPYDMFLSFDHAYISGK